MKVFALFFMIFDFSAKTCEIKDPELENVLQTLMQQVSSKEIRKFPALPTERDLERLESSLFNYDWKLPEPLRKFHLTCGNRFFGVVTFPTVHQMEDDGSYRCYLLEFIRKAQNKGVPFTKNNQATGILQEDWIAFCEDGSDYACIELRTGKVCYFSFVPRLKKDKKEYDTLSAWIKERFLT